MAARLVVGFAIVVVVIGAIWGLQRRMIYFPFGHAPDPPAGVTAVTTTTADDLTLAGWLVPAEEAAPDPGPAENDPVDDGAAAAEPSHDAGSPLVLVFHGNGGNHTDRLPLARALADRGVSVLLASYRGYGGNPGSPSEAGLADDARAWLAWVGETHSGPMALYGESLGTGVAVRLAAETSSAETSSSETVPAESAPTDVAPVAVILRSPFTSLTDVGRVHYPWLPVGWLLRERYPTAELLGDVSAPVLVVLGTADRLIPPEQSRQVHAAAPNPAGLVEVTGADHNDRVLLDGEELMTAVVDLLAVTIGD